jgi:hypothetical protein
VFELSVYLRDRLIGRSAFSSEEVRIGRAPDNEVQIDNLALSRYHASIEQIDGLYLLKDFGSQNGTYVNGEKVNGRRGLNDGDRLGLGKFTLVFHADRITAPAAPEVSDKAAFAVFGETMVSNVSRDLYERTCPFLAYLELPGLPAEGPRFFPLARDVFILGSAAASDLVIDQKDVPARVAAIVRGWRGFSMIALGPGVLRNDKPLENYVELGSRDTIAIGNTRMRFQVGRPDAGP